MTYRLQDERLREWQQKSLPTYLNRRLEGGKYETTVAYQGSGKTIYAAACYVSSVCNAKVNVEQTISEFRNQFICRPNKFNDFIIIFVPRHAIVSSTIRDWKEFGVNLILTSKGKLQKSSPLEMLNKNIDGIVCTYDLAKTNGYCSNGEWEKNYLVEWAKRSPQIKLHANLDEAHHMTITVKEEGGDDPNLASKFFLGNSHLFTSMHLMSGTIVKGRYDSKTFGKISKRVPFVKYSLDGDVIPDTLYSQQDAIKDRVICKTNIMTHSVDYAEIVINKREHSITDKDLIWYADNASYSKEHWHPDYPRLKYIEKSFKALYSSDDLWHPLLKFGDYWLSKVREKHPSLIGIIFAPGRKVAENIHKNILPDRSILCLGKGTRLIGCKFVNSKNISQFLGTEREGLDWIVSCEALNEGFDCPFIKVSILLPRIEFLSISKISQSLGRTNRVISKGNPENIEAVSITLNYKPLLELISNDQKDHYGLIKPEETSNDAIKIHEQQIIEESRERDKARIRGEVTKEAEAIVKDLALDPKAIFLDKSEYEYEAKMKRELDEVKIRTYWSNWNDLLFGNNDLPSYKFPPYNVAGVYIAIHAKTGRCLYVGKAHNLYERVCDHKRINKELYWIPEEGYQDVFVKWVESDNHQDLEDELKEKLKPKYDKEKRRKKP
jgi:GIY-YIG catalytic domain